MCAILGWVGHLPVGLLSRLLLESGSRGKDSTGMTFYGRFQEDESRPDSPIKVGIGTWKRALSPSEFLQLPRIKNEEMKNARLAPYGIAHTRRASPGMRVNDENAHPFQYWDFHFAHNGKVTNWKPLKATLGDHFHMQAAKIFFESLGPLGYSEAEVEGIVWAYYVTNRIPIHATPDHPLVDDQWVISLKEWAKANNTYVSVVRPKPWVVDKRVLKTEVQEFNGQNYIALRDHRATDDDISRQAMANVEMAEAQDLEAEGRDVERAILTEPGSNPECWVEWAGLKPEHARLFSPSLPAVRAVQCMIYALEAETDSKVLAPFINARDFRLVEGCMALVWIKAPHVYVFRYGKEAVVANITWAHKKKPEVTELLCLVASTKEIVTRSFEKIDTDDIIYTIQFSEIAERHVYRLELTGLVDEGEIGVFEKCYQDEFSSQTV